MGKRQAGTDMEWKMSYLFDKKVVLVKVTGTCKPKDAVPMIKMALAEARRTNCSKCLVDATEAEFDYRTLDWYGRPEIYYDLGFSMADRVAVLFDTVAETERFYENTCRNRGLNFSVFSDRKSAMAWLDVLQEGEQPERT